MKLWFIYEKYFLYKENYDKSCKNNIKVFMLVNIREVVCQYLKLIIYKCKSSFVSKVEGRKCEKNFLAGYFLK